MDKSAIPRDVAVVIAEDGRKKNPLFIDGLRRNGVSVTVRRFPEELQEAEARNDNPEATMAFVEEFYTEVRDHHHAFLTERSRREFGKDRSTPRPFLVIVLEDDKFAIAAAAKLGMTVVGIVDTSIELDRFTSYGAHIVVDSMEALLNRYKIRDYHQIQYLPYIVNLADWTTKKAGYPVSLLDTLHGYFTPDGVQIDSTAKRLIPRDVLGVQEKSLADDYINNVGWTLDTIRGWKINCRDIEKDIVRMFARYYDVAPEDMRGFVTSGGTEGNFSGLWWQRDWLKGQSRKSGEPSISPLLLTSDQTHYSVFKAAQQLGIELRIIPSLQDGSMDVAVLRETLQKLDRRIPLIVNVTAGTTQTCAFDDIPAIYAMLDEIVGDEEKFGLHLDAAMMGPVIPIIQPYGPNKVNVFKHFNVKTMAISGHKFFGSTAICGVSLTTAKFLDHVGQFHSDARHVEYVHGLHDVTPSGSRSGFAALSLHNTLCSLYMHTDAGRMRKVVDQCYRNKERFIKKLSAIVGPDHVRSSTFGVNVVFPRPSEEMMSKYSLMPVSLPSLYAPPYELAAAATLLNMNELLMNKFMEDYPHHFELSTLPGYQSPGTSLSASPTA